MLTDVFFFCFFFFLLRTAGDDRVRELLMAGYMRLLLYMDRNDALLFSPCFSSRRMPRSFLFFFFFLFFPGRLGVIIMSWMPSDERERGRELRVRSIYH